MATSTSGIGTGRPATGTITGPSGRRPAAHGPASDSARPAPAGGNGDPPAPRQKQYVHVEGRRFDLSAPRGTYLNILV